MIKATNMPGTLRLKYFTGTDENGKEVYKTRLINNISSVLSDEDAYSMKALLEDVQKNPIAEFTRVNPTFITEE